MTTQLTLRSFFPRVARNDLRPLAQAQRREVQILAVSPDDYRIGTHLLDAIDTVRQRHLMRVTSSPINDKQIRLVRLFRWVTPATARAVDQIITNETILKRVTFRFRESSVIRRRHNLATV